MDPYYIKVRKLEKIFLGLGFHHVERENNAAVDVLSKLGYSRAEVPCSVFVNELYTPSTTELASSNNSAADREVMIIEAARTQPINEYIWTQTLSAKQIYRHAKLDTIIGDTLYRHDTRSRILMKCVSQEEGINILMEIQSG